MFHTVCRFYRWIVSSIKAFLYSPSCDTENTRAHATFETQNDVPEKNSKAANRDILLLSDTEDSDGISISEVTSDPLDLNSSSPLLASNTHDLPYSENRVCDDTLQLFIEFVRESHDARLELFKRMTCTRGLWISYDCHVSPLSKNVDWKDAAFCEEDDRFDEFQDAMEGEVDYLPHPKFLHMAELRAQCLLFEIHGHMEIINDVDLMVRKNPCKHIKWADDEDKPLTATRTFYYNTSEVPQIILEFSEYLEFLKSSSDAQRAFHARMQSTQGVWIAI